MTIKIPIIPNPDGLEQFPTIRPEYPINILPIITPTILPIITPTPIENADIKPGVNNVIVILIIIALLYFIGGKL